MMPINIIILLNTINISFNKLINIYYCDDDDNNNNIIIIIIVVVIIIIFQYSTISI